MNLELYTVTLKDNASYELTVAALDEADAQNLAVELLHDSALPKGTKVIARNTDTTVLRCDPQPADTYDVRFTYGMKLQTTIRASDYWQANNLAKQSLEKCCPLEFNHVDSNVTIESVKLKTNESQ